MHCGYSLFPLFFFFFLSWSLCRPLAQGWTREGVGLPSPSPTTTLLSPLRWVRVASRLNPPPDTLSTPPSLLFNSKALTVTLGAGTCLLLQYLNPRFFPPQKKRPGVDQATGHGLGGRGRSWGEDVGKARTPAAHALLPAYATPGMGSCEWLLGPALTLSDEAGGGRGSSPLHPPPAPPAIYLSTWAPLLQMSFLSFFSFFKGKFVKK